MVRCCCGNYKVDFNGGPHTTQVEQKKTKRVYAMKVIKKDLVLDEEVSII